MATETKQRIVNGVDVRALKETIMAVSEDSDLAQFEFRAHNRWIDGGHNRSTVKGFYGLLGLTLAALFAAGATPHLVALRGSRRRARNRAPALTAGRASPATPR